MDGTAVARGRHTLVWPKDITQRKLRRSSGDIMRQLDQGESFVVTRNGIPVGELSPLRRHRFISAEAAVAAFQGAPRGGVRPVPSRSRSGRQPGDRASWLRLLARRRGSIDTSVVIDLDHIDAEQLPMELAISALTMAELAAGPHATADVGERARRQDRLQRAEASFDRLGLLRAGRRRAYGRVDAAIIATGRKACGPRAFDLLIAATAAAANLPLYTRNIDDFRGLERLLTIVGV